VKALECGKTDKLNHGEYVMIESANYPSEYPNNQKCKYTIKMPKNSAVSLGCETFDLPKGDFLAFGNVKFFGTYQPGTNLYFQYPFEIKKNTIKMMFKSNKKGAGKGYRCYIDVRENSPSTASCSEGIIIAGGYHSGNQKSAEIFAPLSSEDCPVGDLQQARHSHSWCNNLLCGGFGSQTSRTCEMFDGGESNFTLLPVTLLEKRSYHLCWGRKSGDVLLLGGFYSSTTTERVSADGSSSSADFDLAYELYFACGIDLGNRFVVTGGDDGSSRGLTTVAEYTGEGAVTYLPVMNTGRRNHACTKFLNDNGEITLLVTGGRDQTNSEVSSTEIYVDSTWLYAASLPSARHTHVSITLNNSVFVIGGRGGDSYLDEILRYNGTTDSWIDAGKMTEPRRSQAVNLLSELKLPYL